MSYSLCRQTSPDTISFYVEHKFVAEDIVKMMLSEYQYKENNALYIIGDGNGDGLTFSHTVYVEQNPKTVDLEKHSLKELVEIVRDKFDDLDFLTHEIVYESCEDVSFDEIVENGGEWLDEYSLKRVTETNYHVRLRKVKRDLSHNVVDEERTDYTGLVGCIYLTDKYRWKAAFNNNNTKRKIANATSVTESVDDGKEYYYFKDARKALIDAYKANI